VVVSSLEHVFCGMFLWISNQEVARIHGFPLASMFRPITRRMSEQ
jgi:hypothetical protein